MVSRNVLHETLLCRHVLLDCPLQSAGPVAPTRGDVQPGAEGCASISVDEVLAEFLTFSSTLGAHIRTQAARTVRNALDDPQWTVLPQSRTSLLDALTLYESRSDKEDSLTDWVSMQAMRREGLTDVLSNDHHFTQEGFHILFA
jgi:uncharacterized protein